MPIYEYRCTSCGGVFEKIQKFSDPPVTACVSCDGKVEKLVSRTAFQLKGGGWYASGYSESPPKSESADPGKKKKKTEDKKPGGESPSSGNGCGSSCSCH